MWKSRVIDLSHSIAGVPQCLANSEMLPHRIFSHPQLCFSQIAKKWLVHPDLPNFQLDLIWEDKEGRSKYSNGWFYRSCPPDMAQANDLHLFPGASPLRSLQPVMSARSSAWIQKSVPSQRFHCLWAAATKILAVSFNKLPNHYSRGEGKTQPKNEKLSQRHFKTIWPPLSPFQNNF